MFGDARFFGSTGSIHLNKPIVGMAATPDGNGGPAWWPPTGASSTSVMPGSSARPAPSHLNKPVVGHGSHPRRQWVLAGGLRRGHLQTPAPGTGFYGSTGSIHLNEPIVGMATSPDGGGYWLGGLRWRPFQLRRRSIPWLNGGTSCQRSDRGPGLSGGFFYGDHRCPIHGPAHATGSWPSARWTPDSRDPLLGVCPPTPGIPGLTCQQVWSVTRTPHIFTSCRSG